MWCLLGRLEVLEEVPAPGVGAMSRCKEMRVGDGLVPGAGIVAEDHADAAGLLHHQTLLDSAVLSSGAHNYLAAHLGRVQRAGQAQRSAGNRSSRRSELETLDIHGARARYDSYELSADWSAALASSPLIIGYRCRAGRVLSDRLRPCKTVACVQNGINILYGR